MQSVAKLRLFAPPDERRYGCFCAWLQAYGTKDAEEKLRTISGRERQFTIDTNHAISKQIVYATEGTKRGSILEDLKGILQLTTVAKIQRERHHRWAFHQLRSFAECKTQGVRRPNGTEQDQRRGESGVPVNMIDGAYTSRQCSACGSVHPGNRLTQAAFRCHTCGHTGNADLNASVDVAVRPLSTGLLVSAPPTPGERWSRRPGKSMLSRAAACPRQKEGVVAL